MYVIIPAKPFNQSKTRLAQTLTLNQRINLSRYLFIRTVRLAQQVGQVVVVSRDKQVRDMAKQTDAWALVESGINLNAAIQQATDWVIARGGQLILILPIDLPLLTVNNLREMVALAQQPQTVVIAPCHRIRGTNALLVRPPNLMQFSFGRDSFSKHKKAAQHCGVEPLVYQSSTIALDLDYPTDLQQVLAKLQENSVNPKSNEL